MEPKAEVESGNHTGDSIRIFISHASADEGLCRDLVAYLEAEGLPCWAAWRDIPKGHPNYMQGVLEGLKRCNVLLLLYSKHINESPHVPRELDRALNWRIPILPVCLDETPPALGIEYAISLPQRLNALEPDKARYFPEIAEAARGLPDLKTESPETDDSWKVTPPGPRRQTRRPLKWRLALIMILILGALASGAALFNRSRWTAEQESALGEALSYTGIHMAALNNTFDAMKSLYRDAGTYVEGAKSGQAWHDLAASLNHAKEQVAKQTETPEPLPDRVAQILQGTELSVADVVALHQFLEMQTKEYADTIEVLRYHLSPDSPMSVAHQKELLRIYGEMLQETADTIYLGVCEFLSPVASKEQMRNFRSEVVRDWTYFPSSYQSFWDESPQMLEDAQNQAWQKLNVLVADLATLTGNMQASVNTMEQIAESRRGLLDQFTADWQGLDAYVRAVSDTVTPKALASITALWDGTESVSPALRKEHHERLCKALREASAKAGDAVFASATLTDAKLKLVEKGNVPPEIMRAVYEAMGTVREKHEWLLDRIDELSAAQKRPDVERYAEEVRTAAEKASGWAEATHLVCLGALALFPAELQAQPLTTLATFQALEPTTLPSEDELVERGQALSKRLGEGVDESLAQVEATRSRLGEVEKELEEARNRLREKCRITPDDEPGLVTGKALRLRECGLIDDAVAAFEQYGKMFANMPQEAGDHLLPEAVSAYTKAGAGLTRNLAEYGVEGGAFIFGFQGSADPAPLQKFDVVIRFNGQPTKDADAFVLELKAAKAIGKPVAVELLRLDANGALHSHEVTYMPDPDCLVGVLDI